MKKWNILVPVLVVALLLFTFWYGGDVPDQQGWTAEPSTATQSLTPTLETAPQPSVSSTVEPDVDSDVVPDVDSQAAPSPASAPESTDVPIVASVDQQESPEQETDIAPETQVDASLTDVAPEATPLPTEPETATISDTLLTCTLSVRCDTILGHMDWLTAGKVDLVPQDGVIFPETQVTFYEGESVFNVLVRELKGQKIHLEFTNTPLYNSAYIEGIHNLYEFDVGEGSGWMYSVNDWFPNYGCSRYALEDGDVIAWVYTCDLGADVGAGMAGEGQILEQS